MRLAELRYQLVAVARTGGRFSGFGPYVAAIDERGTVRFTAVEAGGGVEIFAADRSGRIEPLASGGADSHPAGNAAGGLAYYRDGEVVAAGVAIADLKAGPLGPTINDAGVVGARARLAGGVEAVVRWSDGATEIIADTGGELAGFYGLPCVSASGSVAFHAETRAGEQRLCVAPAGGEPEVWATAQTLDELGKFCAIDATELVVFAGDAGVSAVRQGSAPFSVVSEGFSSYRGALARSGEVAVFYATPLGGTLGIYSAAGRLIGLGDRFDGSDVVDLALNPVSINESGELAVRVGLASGVEVIARGEPDWNPW